jgi:hypothetical protein
MTFAFTVAPAQRAGHLGWPSAFLDVMVKLNAVQALCP